MKKKEVAVGTIRIGTDLWIYEKTQNSWKKSNKISAENFPEAFHVINLFKANNGFKELIDKVNPRFLKGQLSPDGKCQGARINILPDGKKLSGAYSLFAKKLTIHDQESSAHWDVLYENPNGQFAYLYTAEKEKKAVNKKFSRVRKFEKVYPKLKKNVSSALNKGGDYMALPIYTLIKTYMRVGNEIYFRLHKHKGLTTLKKGDIKVRENIVNFKYLLLILIDLIKLLYLIIWDQNSSEKPS